MPELPEVETMVRGIRPHVIGRKIRQMRICQTACKPLTLKPVARKLTSLVTGQTIAAVERLAKRVVLVLSDASHLAIEPRMTGLMLLSDPPSIEHLRIEWQLAGAGDYPSLWFWDRRGLGTVTHYPPGLFDRELRCGRLGPDALVATLADWQRICSQTSRPIKVLLLDQKRIAGIGNLYASEILHRTRIHPETPSEHLHPTQIEHLRDATLFILHEAIRYEGSTLSDGTYRNALNKSGGYQNAHKVYDREQKPCETCGQSEIVRIVQAQRSTFFCPVCQPKTRSGRRRQTS